MNMPMIAAVRQLSGMRSAARVRARILFLLSALMLVWAATPSDAARAQDMAPASLPGLYAALGKDSRGQVYKGAVRILPYGDALAFLWKLENGGGYKGLGFIVGDVLGAAYGTDQPFGLAIYKVAGGRLSGRWILSNSKEKALNVEDLQGPEGLNGIYEIVRGENPDNTTAYGGKVEIKPNGKTYLLRWYTPDLSNIGTGILVGDVLVVAYGRTPHYGVVAYKPQGGRLEGVWAGALSNALGVEILARQP